MVPEITEWSKFHSTKTTTKSYVKTRAVKTTFNNYKFRKMLAQYFVYCFMCFLIVGIEYINVCNSYHLDLIHASYNNLSRYTRQTGCWPVKEFTCDNGQCQPAMNYCDGKVDCTDESDEKSNCNPIGCSNNEFQCAYGACIKASAKCDGKKDCRDNSDENAITCNTLRPDECLPPIIENGNFTLPENNYYILGDPIPNLSVVNIFCVNSNFILNKPYSIVYCINGTFIGKLPKCVLTCATTFPKSIDVDCKLDGIKEDCTKKNVRAGTIAHMKCRPDFIDKNPEISKINCLSNGLWDVPPKLCTSPHKCPPRPSSTINVYCELDGVTQDCNQEVPDGTYARMACKPNYIDMNDGPTEAMCFNRTWTKPLKKCIPDCNQIVPEGHQTFIINGSSTNRGDFPWHVAIYRQKADKPIDYICGGTIISVKVALSAAHCFTNLNNGELYPTSEFMLAAGKIYSKWDAHDDEYYAQKKKVISIQIKRDTYFGEQSRHDGDLAVVIVDKSFTFTDFVRAVCVDWHSEYTDQQLVDGSLGKLAGWGKTSTENPLASVKLQQLRIPYVKRAKCLNIIPNTFRAYLTSDKLCAGYTNGSSVCDGDSGSGLIFSYHNKNQIKKYYLQGIVSSGPLKEGFCDDFQVGVYTKISTYIPFIKEIEESNRISVDCVVPKIANGKFTASGLQYTAGSLVKESFEITVECDSGYKLSVNNLPKCIRGQWSIEIPKCEQETVTPVEPVQPTGEECPAPEILNGKYEVIGNPNYISGNPIPNGSIIEFTCNSETYSLTTINNFVLCINGEIKEKLPKCVPSCPARNSTSVDIKCELNGIEISCVERVPEGVIATMKCKQHYVRDRGYSTSICMGGSWDVPLIKCISECGEVSPNAQPLIIGGSTVKKGDFPWHVGIYRQEPKKPFKFYCSGSIISVKIVLSVAHCFARSNGQLYPISEYHVGAGKYYSDWDAPGDEHFVQKRNVSKVEVPNKIFFAQLSNYAGDIAVVVVDTPFTLTNLVKPVCVDWSTELVKNQLKNGTLGEIAGWGIYSFTEYKPSPELKQLAVPYVEPAECFKIVPPTFQMYITLDKYCAGYTNGSSICRGDIGGGMVFPHVNLGDKKYYIQGIASLAPRKDGSCENHQLAVYTKVSHHIEFIKTIEENNRIE